jgi:CheY-like chemotaxis protein
MSSSPVTDGDTSRHSRSPRRSGVGLTILVIDSSRYLGDVLVSALEADGCAAVVARSASQALQFAPSLSPDLITIDIDPDSDVDAELAQRLSGSAPLIVITESARHLPAWVTERAARVFEKPFYLAAVVAAVLDTLGRTGHP